MSSGDPTRIRLLNACFELLTEGAGEPTMGAVAVRAGVSRQAVYLHFPSRTDLLFAMVDHVNAEAGLPAKLAQLDEAGSSMEALAILVEILIWQAYRLGPAIVALHRLADSDPDLKQRWRARSGRLKRLSIVVSALHRDGALRSELTTREAVALLNAMTLPATIVALRESGFSQKRLTAFLTAGVTRLLCDPSG